MSILLIGALSIIELLGADIGLASTFNDKIIACPRSSYKHTGLPIVAHRTLPCGTIINVKRVDNNKVARAVVGDRGPYGCCKPATFNTRACGHGSKWVNGRNFIRHNKPMNSATWRGILDMSPLLAKRLGIKNRLAKVIIYTDDANIIPSILDTDEDDIDDPKIQREIK